jgi:hypothetical protein
MGRILRGIVAMNTKMRFRIAADNTAGSGISISSPMVEPRDIHQQNNDLLQINPPETPDLRYGPPASSH